MLVTLIKSNQTTERSWATIFVDAVICTLLFVACNLIGSLIFSFVLHIKPNPSHAVIWMPLWCMFMLPVAIYAKLRGHIHFDYQDLAWYSPVMFAIGGAIDWFGTESIFVTLIGFLTYITIATIKSLVVRRRLARTT
jgi:hypothetical protein